MRENHLKHLANKNTFTDFGFVQKTIINCPFAQLEVCVLTRRAGITLIGSLLPLGGEEEYPTRI